MSFGSLAAFVFAYGVALWLGLYLIGKDPRSPRLALTGLGAIAYSLAIACGLLESIALPGLAAVSWPLLLLPALFWTGALVYLLPEKVGLRTRLARIWAISASVIVLTMALMVSIDVISSARIADRVPGIWGVRVLLGIAVLVPMLALGCLVWSYLRRYRTSAVAGVIVVFTLFFALSTVLMILPSGLLPRGWTLLAAGVDVVALGLAIAYFDAFDQGEALMPDMVRSFDASLIAVLVFGGQVTLVILLSTGPTPPLMVLLLATVATAIAAATLNDRIAAVIDRVALGRLPLVRRDRSELRETARSLQRRDYSLDPAELDEAEFTRITRRALSNFGDLPRLSANPLINLPLVDERLAARHATDDVLERAAELKSILSESIARLKPRTGADFGTSDEWRYYNALYFPYVMGLKPYSNRDRTNHKDPIAREAREWFRDTVPERTLYNWQNSAAKLVAQDLRSNSAA